MDFLKSSAAIYLAKYVLIPSAVATSTWIALNFFAKPLLAWKELRKNGVRCIILNGSAIMTRNPVMNGPNRIAFTNLCADLKAFSTENYFIFRIFGVPKNKRLNEASLLILKLARDVPASEKELKEAIISIRKLFEKQW